MKPANYPTAPLIWDIFFDITRIPRPSRKEEKMMEYIIRTAEEHQLKYVKDSANNIVVYVPGTPGYEDHDTVVIQSHMDMVTQNTPDREINFDTDPIEVYVEDGWLKADRTTLGSDNGMGMAAAIATIKDPDCSHPPLELLFTSDEETGLNGATNIDMSNIHAQKMLNLDTEEWGEIYIGCAGGQGYEMTRSLDTTDVRDGQKMYEIKLGKLSGGHSGVQIHEQLGNAIRLLGEVLQSAKSLDYQLIEFDGGTAHNVIPRDAAAIIAMPSGNLTELQALTDDAITRWKTYLPEVDHKVNLTVTEAKNAGPALTDDHRNMLLNLIQVLPHGALTYNFQQPADLVDLSANNAIVVAKNGQLQVTHSIRYFNQLEAVALNQQIDAIAETFQLKKVDIHGYPSWNPEFNNPMLKLALDTYEEMYGERPEIKAIHAGLECGILKGKKQDLDIVSFGPTIKGAHSPTERVNIETVNEFYRYFKTILAKL